MFSETMVSMIRTATITLIWNKGLKALGKKDFSEIIMASGIAVCGIDLVKLIAFWKESPPLLVKLFRNINKTLEKTNQHIDGFFEKTDKFGEMVGKIIERGKR